MTDHEITLTIDGRTRTARVPARRLLVQALRDDFGISAPRIGCESGRCGACTVLVDGSAAKSCMLLAVQADNADVVTAAGLAGNEELHHLQAAFREHHALQCGYCTPGESNQCGRHE